MSLNVLLPFVVSSFHFLPLLGDGIARDHVDCDLSGDHNSSVSDAHQGHFATMIEPFGFEHVEGQEAYGMVMMPSVPLSDLIVGESEFLLGILKSAFDPVSLRLAIGELFDGGLFKVGVGEVVFEGNGSALGIEVPANEEGSGSWGLLLAIPDPAGMGMVIGFEPSFGGLSHP